MPTFPSHSLRTLPPSTHTELVGGLERDIPPKLISAPPAAAAATSLIESDLSIALLHDERPLVKRALGALVDASVIVWTTSARRGPVSFIFDGRSYSAQAGPLHWTATDSYWVNGALRALTIRRQDALSAALSFPPELLNGASNAISDEWRFALFEALRSLLLGEPDVTGERITRAKQLTNPAIATVGGPRYARRALSELEMMEAIVARDQSAFTRASWRALEAHRALFGRGRERNYSGCFFAFRVVGLAALAFDLGLQWEIDCAYTPRWLVEGRV